MSTSDEDSFVDLKITVTELRNSISALNEVTGEVSGRLTLKKAFAAIDALTRAVNSQSDALEYFLERDRMFDQAMSDLQEEVLEIRGRLNPIVERLNQIRLNPIVERLNQIGDVKTEIERLNRIHEVKTSKTNQTGDAKTSKNAKNSFQEGNSIPESLLLDHLQTVDFEKSNVTIYGIPNEQFLSDYEVTGNQIVESVMNGEKIRVKSIKNVRNTKMDKDDTFRILIKFTSPYEAQKFVGKCDKNATWSYRLGMTKLERHYSRQTVTRISNLNRNLSKDCGYKYVRSGIFSFTKTPL